jgi:hypothetical protein
LSEGTLAGACGAASMTEELPDDKNIGSTIRTLTKII